jgi:hypothetical protein
VMSAAAVRARRDRELRKQGAEPAE